MNEEKGGLDLQKLDPASLPDAERIADPYGKRMVTWLSGLSANTRDTYLTAVQKFFRFAGKHPSDVEPTDIVTWKETLKDELADSTVAQRLSALSSYYEMLTKRIDGLSVLSSNPVKSLDRRDLDVSPYENAKKLTLPEFRRILEEIDTTTAAGARDKAIFLFYFLCARRRKEVTELRFGEIRETDDGGFVYRARVKGGERKWKDLPPPVLSAIQQYMKTSDRTDPDREDPVFINHDHNHPTDRPITGNAVYRALRRYARQAGIEEDRVSLHALRHLGAEEYNRQASSVRETQEFLDHAKLETTEGYLRQMEGQDHRYWDEMFQRLETGQSD